MEKLNRYECIARLTERVSDELIVCWTGFYDIPNLLKERGNYCYFSCLGSTVSLGIGLALALPHRKVFAFSSDGDILMELGALASLAKANPKNLIVFVNDNETYQTVGGYPTMTADKADLAAIARGAGVEHAVTVRTMDKFEREVDAAFEKNKGARFIVLKTEPAPFKELPETTERVQSKYRFVKYIEQSEGIRIFAGPIQDQKLSEKKSG